MKLKTILPVIVIIVCLSAMWSAYRKFDIKSRTYTVTYVSLEDSVSGECLTIKNEHPIKSDVGGFFQNTVANGSRVFKGQTVGGLYIGDFDPQLVNSLNTVNEKLREAQLTQSSKETLINDAMTVDNTIFSYTSTVSEFAADRNQQYINKLRRDIDSLLQRKKSIAEGTSGKAVSEVNSLNAQKLALEAQLGNTKKNIISPASGLFIMDCDGFEEQLTIGKIEQLSVKQMENIINNNETEEETADQPGSTDEMQGYAPAKVTDNNKWVLAAICKTEKAQYLKVGADISVRLKTEGERTIGCTVEYISPDEDGQCIIFVSGTKEIENIYNSRTVDAEILIKDYKGLKVPKKAVVKEKEGEFVSVLINGIIEHKRIEIVYEDDEFVIARDDDPGDNALKLYDEVISQ